MESIFEEPEDWERRRNLEAWLDRGYGEYWRKYPAIAGLVEGTLLFANSVAYRLQAWVVMPNHVNMVVDVWQVPLAHLLKTWKGARRLTPTRSCIEGPF